MKNAKPPASSQKKRPYIVRESTPCFVSYKALKGPYVGGLMQAKHGQRENRRVAPSGALVLRRRNRPPSRSFKARQMKELLRVGLVRMERQRTDGMLTDRLTGRKRWRSGVLGEVHYTVFKSPHKDWFSYAAAQKSPHKQRAVSKVQFSRPLESRNTPNKTEGRNDKSPHKQRVSTMR